MINKHKRIVSLARKRTRNPDKESQILDKYLPKFSAIVPEDGGMLEKIDDIFFGLNNSFDAYVLEIGFGSGENLIFNSLNFPNKGFIGCEVFSGGVVTLLKEIEQKNLSNIRIWHDDALDLIARLPANSLSLVYILHPDPWPKTRHHKRRLVNREFLTILARKMKTSGEILIITDHKDYANAIEKEIAQASDLFVRKYENYPSITKTKYRLKADEIGIESKYFSLLKP
jgi:tRNA (guanine-N7-)-methyltransferase